MAETLYERAVRRIAELTGRDIKKAVDPDDADARVDGEGEPTDKKLEAAGEEAAAGGQAAGGSEGGVPADPGAGDGAGGEGDGHAEPDGDEGQGGDGDGDGDEGQDMSDDEIRDLRKAFGLTDFDEIAETKKDHQIPSLLKSILAYMQKSDAFMQNLTKELADMKAKHASGKPDEAMRVTMKALDEKVDSLQKLLENMHKLAPAAAQPKAILKAMDPGVPPQPKLTIADITALSLKGEITAAEASRLTRMVNHNLTPA